MGVGWAIRIVKNGSVIWQAHHSNWNGIKLAVAIGTKALAVRSQKKIIECQ